MRRNRRIWYTSLLVFFAVFLFTFLVGKASSSNTSAASLSSFDPGYIISDYQMGNYQSMSEVDIQNFLTAKNPCSNTNYSYYLSLSANKKYTWHWQNGHFVCLSEERFGDGEVIGSGQTAAHIIWQAAQDYRINPQVLIVLLQKETSLITDPVPNNGDYRKATGYGCPDTAPCSSQYYGFKNQVRKAAEMFRTVLDGGWTNYPLGNNYIQYNPNASCGGSIVNIRSLATSALYRYTPYQPNAGALAAGYGTAACGAYGNRNFYLYFEDWFGGITATQKSVIVPEGTYYIQSATNTNVVEVAGGRKDNGANVQLYKRNDTVAQQWKVTYNKTTDDYNIINVGSSKALDVDGASTANGTNVQVYDSNNSCAQRWKFVRNTDDEIRIISACTASKVLDISGGIMKSGINIQIWSDNRSNAQKWKLVPIDEVSNGLYYIEFGTNKAKVVDIAGGSHYAPEGRNVQIYDKNYSSAQKWYFEKDTNGYYTIKNKQSGKVLDIDRGSVDNKANIHIWLGNNTCAQKWRVMKKGDKYLFISACSYKVLDLDNGNTTNGTNVQIYQANNSDTQKWMLEKAEIVGDAEYRITSVLNKDKSLDVAGGFNMNGANVQIYQSNNTNAQKWKIAYNKTWDYYSIINVGSGRMLDVSGAGIANGTNTHIWSRNGTCAQEWIISKTDDGKYLLYSVCSGKPLDVAGGLSSNGTNVRIFQLNGTNAQKWQIVKQ